MPNTRIFKQAFVSGELSSQLYGRVDLDKYSSGVAKAQNMIILPHGPAMSRPGFKFVREVRDSTKRTRLIPFSFSSSQTFAIEMGGGYFRFHTLGATLSPGTVAAYDNGHAYAIGDMASSGGIIYYCIQASTGNAVTVQAYWRAMPAGIYEIPSPYAEVDLFNVKYTQSGDVITLCHPDYAPRELKRYSNTRWILSMLTFASSTPAPTGCAVVKTQPNAGTNKSFQYGVTALNALGFEESLLSNVPAAVKNDLTIDDNYNTITWNAVSGASRYNVYKYANGTFGYIGQTAALTFVDDNIIADLTKTVPIQESFFASANNYPSTVAYYEQRRFFANSINAPQNIWSTQSASDYNMAYSIPSQDSDALRFRIAANRANAIRHLVPLIDLIMLTASTEWRCFSGGDTALSPSSITIKAQSQNGASDVLPVVVNNFLLYEQAQGGHVREMSYQWQGNGYQSNDISLLAHHLFDNYHLVDMAFSRAPYPILWCVSSSGKLLGLTYVPEQKIAAWHQHTAGGVFESCCTVTEGGVDALYVIVNRAIGGVTKRYVELLHDRDFAAASDAFFVDSGLTYSGAPTTTLSGLDHLEGRTVAVLGDGAVFPQKTVSSGSITLEFPVSKAQVGLPITAELETLPLALYQDSAQGRSRVKSINQIWVRVDKTGIFKAGPSAEKLTEFALRTTEPYGAPPNLKTQELPLVVRTNWTPDGKVVIRQDDPLPLTVVDVTIEASFGG